MQAPCLVRCRVPLSLRSRSIATGILNTYKSLFGLDDSLAEIKTRDALFDYLKMVSAQVIGVLLTALPAAPV